MEGLGRLLSRNRAAWWVLVGSVILAIIFITDATPWVRGGYGWRWEYHPAAANALLGIGVFLGYSGLADWLIHKQANRWAVLSTAFIAAALLPLLTLAMHGDVLYGLFSRIFSEVASHHMVGAASIDWVGGEWRDWPLVMERLGSHVATSPPGLLLAYGLVTDLADKTGLASPLSRPLIAALCTDYKLYDLTPAEIASGWLGVLYPVWSALTVIPLYALARKIGTRPELPTLLWPLVPGLGGFAASNSTLFPLLAVLMMLPLVGRPTFWRLCVSGLMFGLATFVNLALLPLAGLAGYFVLVRWLISTPRPSFLHPIRLGIYFGLGALIPWVIWFALTGDTPLDIVRQSFEFHLELERPYWFWVWFHVWDWAVWGGLAVCIAALSQVLPLWRNRTNAPDTTALALTSILTLLTLTISGITRGESGRIWLFLVPCVLVLLATAENWRWRDLALSQSVLTFALAFAITPFSAPDVPVVPPLSETANGTPQHLFSENGTPAFGILGYQAHLDGDTLNLTLEVVGQTPPLTPAWFGMALVAPDGTIRASEPLQPVTLETGERLPATCWTRGKTAKIVLHQPLSAPLPSGEGYYISLSVYDYRANGAVWTVDGAQTQIGLGPFTLGNP